MEKRGILMHRITSYNVCYTKLLRGACGDGIIDVLFGDDADAGRYFWKGAGSLGGGDGDFSETVTVGISGSQQGKG